MEEAPARSGEFLGEIPPEQRRLDELKARKALYEKFYRKTAKGREGRKRGKRNNRMNKRLSHPFVGVDGEGSELSYLLLRAGDDYLHTGQNLSFVQCMDFLCDLPEDFTYVAFFFDYDVSMMTRLLPAERLQRLMNPSVRTNPKTGYQAPIDVGDFQIDYRPTKEFKVRRAGTKHWTVINDVGSFFQCSFVKALTSWGIGTPEELAKVKAGKDMRTDFTVMDAEVIEYNRIECELLAFLMTKFGAACRGINYLPRKWQGPGELAASMLHYHGIPKRKDLEEYIPLDLFEAANKAYYGGRFEMTAAGHVKAPLYNLDINSAYPDSIRTLPCLEHGSWSLDDKPSGDLSLVFGTYRPTGDIRYQYTLRDEYGARVGPYLYGLPNRTEMGNISYPESGRGWYWLHEVEMARHQEFSIEIAWNFRAGCDHVPFDWVPDLYLKRKQWERQSDTTAANMGIALKLALNSLYGKLCQSIGSAPYANPVYASLITSLTRTKLYEMVHELSNCANGERCGHPILSLATDGLLSTVQLGESGLLGPNLGQWGQDEILEDTLLVQPGVTLGAEGLGMKTRGIPKAKAEAFRRQFSQAWRAIYGYSFTINGPLTKVYIPFHQFLGLKQAVAFNALDRCGTWTDLPRAYSYDYSSKRSTERVEVHEGHFRTLPRAGLGEKETTGYSKYIGRWIDDHREWFDKKTWFEAQPERASLSVDTSDFRIDW